MRYIFIHRNFITFWCFTIHNTEPSAVFFALTRLNDKTAFDDGTKYTRFIRSKPFRFAQFLHSNRTPEWFDVVVVVCVIIGEMMIRCPPLDLADDCVGSAAWLLIHLSIYCIILYSVIKIFNYFQFESRAQCPTVGLIFLFFTRNNWFESVVCNSHRILFE